MRIIDTISQSNYPLIKTTKPRRSGHFGRTWDQDGITLNNQKVYVWRDFTWGSFNYLELDGQWYKFTVEATDMNKRAEFITK